MSKQDKKTSAFLISILLLVFAAISCLAFKPVFANAETDPADFSIRIVHTNDIHARVEESESDGIIGAERLKTIIDTYTADCDLSLVLDSGDLYHGLPIATVSEGGSIAELVNALGYDAMTVGNHDWNYGQDRLKELIEESDLQVLTGNVVCEDGTKFFEEEFLIRTIEKDGRTLKVGLFGLIDPAVYNATDPALLEGLKYTDAAQYANSAARSLREKGRRILSAYVGEQPLDPDADYTVALNDYLADVDAIPLLVSAPKTGEYIACDQTLISYFSLPAELISTDVNEARIIPTDETDWEFIGFLWTGDEVNGYTAAAAEFVCREDRIHTLFVPAEITEHVTEPTVSDIGKTTYAATAAADVCPDKTMHTESKDAKIKDKISPAAGEDSGSAVKTGDTSNSILWLIILVSAAAIAIASVIVFRMGNKRE